MTPLKLVVQSALAGLYGGTLIALLTAGLRPAPPGGGPPAGLAAVVVVYALLAALIWPALYGALRFFASRPLHPRWLSGRYLAGFHAANGVVLTGCLWATLSRYRRVLDADRVGQLGHACLAMSLAWLVAVVVASVPALRRSSLALGCVVATALLVLPFLPRVGDRSTVGGAGRPAGWAPGLAPARQLTLLNFDGAELDQILAMQALGKLPAMSRMSEEGGYGRLRSLVPCVAPVTRATLITGTLPFRHGVRNDHLRRFAGGGASIDLVPAAIGFDRLMAPFFRAQGLSSSDRRAPALWEIAQQRGGAGQAAGWDVDPDAAGAATAGEERGGAAAVAQGTGPALMPTELPADAARRAILEGILDPEVLDARDELTRRLVAELERAVADDEAVRTRLRREPGEPATGVLALSFPGIDRVGHAFLRSARPGDFGNVTKREIERFGGVLEGYYRYIDGIVAEAIDRAAADSTALLLVTSTHGMKPEPLRRRFFAPGIRGGLRSGTHSDGPDGFLFARGPSVLLGHRFGKGSLADVTPTALYALGLPVARDLDGGILAGLFTERYTFRNPVAVIDSYGPRP